MAVYAAVWGAGRALGYVCAPSLIQKVVEKCCDLPSDVAAYAENRDALYGALTEMGYECVEPQGNTCGLIYRSLAQMPARGFRPLVMALPKTTTSGVMPKFWRPQSLPVR